MNAWGWSAWPPCISCWMPVSNVSMKEATMQLTSNPPRLLTGELLLLLAGLGALGSLATNIILPAFPSMDGELGTTAKELSATLGTFFVAFAVGQLFVGPLSDQFGRKRLVLCGLAVFVGGSAVCALAANLPQLITKDRKSTRLNSSHHSIS